VGDRVVAWPSGVEARVEEIATHDGPRETASAGRSVTVVLDRQVDVARGDVLSHAEEAPTVTRHLRARLVWLDREPLAVGGRYGLKIGALHSRATIEAVDSRLDLRTLEPDRDAGTLEFNDLGSVRIATARPVVADAYAANRGGGSFILVDEVSNRTVAAGMVEA
jgi:sulfate adenylyltransferase subunit 1 (EFTu-like GTPase family)